MKLVDGFDSNYRFIQVAAKRARQLQNGSRPQMETVSRKAIKIAMDEVASGKVNWSVPEIPKTAVQVAADILDTGCDTE